MRTCGIFVRIKIYRTLSKQNIIIIWMVEKEVCFDDIEQKTIKPPRNGCKKTLKRYIRYPCLIFCAKIASLRTQLGHEIAKLLHPFKHHWQQHPTSAPTTTPKNVRSCYIHLQVANWAHAFFEKFLILKVPWLRDYLVYVIIIVLNFERYCSSLCYRLWILSLISWLID